MPYMKLICISFSSYYFLQMILTSRLSRVYGEGVFFFFILHLNRTRSSMQFFRNHLLTACNSKQMEIGVKFRRNKYVIS